MAHASASTPLSNGEDSPLLGSYDQDISPLDSKQIRPEMTFLIRPYDSFTARLRDATGSAKSIRMLVEGPYGHTAPFGEFSNVLFIVGGSGIVVPLTHLASLVASPRVRQVRIIWASREHTFVADVLQRDFGTLLSSDKVQVKVCITHLVGGDLQHRIPKSVEVRFGRPFVGREVEMAMNKVDCSDELAVVSCGPATMADATRAAVVDGMIVDGPSVEYFEESFK